jgi:hypothetical protein
MIYNFTLGDGTFILNTSHDASHLPPAGSGRNGNPEPFEPFEKPCALTVGIGGLAVGCVSELNE